MLLESPRTPRPTCLRRAPLTKRKNATCSQAAPTGTPLSIWVIVQQNPHKKVRLKKTKEGASINGLWFRVWGLDSRTKVHASTEPVPIFLGSIALKPQSKSTLNPKPKASLYSNPKP